MRGHYKKAREWALFAEESERRGHLQDAGQEWLQAAAHYAKCLPKVPPNKPKTFSHIACNAVACYVKSGRNDLADKFAKKAGKDKRATDACREAMQRVLQVHLPMQ